MAQETRGQTLDRSGSFRHLNPRAPEFVPRDHGTSRAKFHHHHHQPHHVHHPPVMHLVYQPIPPPQINGQFVVPSVPGMYQHRYGNSEYYGEHEVDLDHDLVDGTSCVKNELADDIAQKIVKQVEYYFSDANLATTEHLMRFITKDPEGYVPIPVVASFKKIKALAPNNSFLAEVLRTSSKLVVSEDGKKVKREQLITESDVEELQSRIIVAENLPDNHCYQSLMKVFSSVGSVKTIRTCYPQAPNGSSSATNRSSKLDMMFANKLHAFVEYETAEDAGKAIPELNDDGKNWRSGLRVRLLSSCMASSSKQGMGKGRKTKTVHENDGNIELEDASTTTQPRKVNHPELVPLTESQNEHDMSGEVPNEKESGQAKHGKGHGHGSNKGRGRGHYSQSNNHNHHKGGTLAIGTPPGHHHPMHNSEQPLVSKQPPGPRMPNGTKGFTMGRGKPLLSPLV